MAGRIILGLANPSLDANGAPVSGATLTFYQKGTTTPQSIYTTATLATPLANPLPCDAGGVFPEVWAPDTSAYDVKWSRTGLADVSIPAVYPVAGTNDTQTLSNKTLTAPVLGAATATSLVVSGAITAGSAAITGTLTTATISATGSIGTTNASGFVNASAGFTSSWTIGGIFSNNSVTIQSISGGVILANNATSWASASDETLKTEIAPFASPLEKVSSIVAGTGRFLTEDESVSRSFLSAQSVQAVLPEAISYHDGKRHIETEVDGEVVVTLEIDPSMEGKLLLRYADVIPLLVAALGEVKGRLEAVESK